MLLERIESLDLIVDLGFTTLLPSQVILGFCLAGSLPAWFGALRDRHMFPLVIVSASILTSLIATMVFAPERAEPVTTATIQTLAVLSLAPLLRDYLRHPEKNARLLKSTKIFFAFNVGLILVSFLFPGATSLWDPGSSGKGGRVFGIIGDQVAWILVIPFIAVVRANRPWAALLIISSLLMTGSIGAFLLLLGEGILLLYRRSQLRIVRVGAFLFVALLIVLGFTLSGARGFGTIGRLLTDSIFEPGGVGYHRALAFENALSSIPDQPLLGFGVGGYSTEMNAAWADYASRNPDESLSIFVSTHNQFLQTAAETGLIGLILFICLVVSLLKLRTKLLAQVSLDPWSEALVRWSTGLLLFNQSAVWIVPGSYLLYFAVVGWGLIYARSGQHRIPATPLVKS
jgi:O-antigen ligase